MGAGTETEWAMGPKMEKSMSKRRQLGEEADLYSHQLTVGDQEPKWLSSWLPKGEARLEGPPEERSQERLSPRESTHITVRPQKEEGLFLKQVKELMQLKGDRQTSSGSVTWPE